MSDYRLEFSSFVGPNDTDRLYNLLSIVTEDDELEITMDSDEPEQVNAIVDMLESNEFEVSTRGEHNGGKYHLVAHRKH